MHVTGRMAAYCDNYALQIQILSKQDNVNKFRLMSLGLTSCHSSLSIKVFKKAGSISSVHDLFHIFFHEFFMEF